MSLQLAAAAYIYIHYAGRGGQIAAAVVAKATVLKQGSVQCFKFISGLELSVGQWGYIKISPECLLLNLNI
jgi:hypothetical protein